MTASATNNITANEVGAYTYAQANASNAADRVYTDGATNAITLQEVVTRGGAVTSGAVTIDSANARTNTFGGLLTVLGQAVQSGRNTGTRTIGPSAYGANQSGLNEGTQTIGSSAGGSRQEGSNAGAQAIGAAAYGAIQSGNNFGTQVIGEFDRARSNAVL